MLYTCSTLQVSRGLVYRINVKIEMYRTEAQLSEVMPWIIALVEKWVRFIIRRSSRGYWTLAKWGTDFTVEEDRGYLSIILSVDELIEKCRLIRSHFLADVISLSRLYSHQFRSLMMSDDTHSSHFILIHIRLDYTNSYTVQFYGDKLGGLFKVY